MEETLKLILSKLESMDKDIKELKQDIKELKQDIKEIKVEQKEMKKTIGSIHEQTADLIEFRTTTTDTLETIECKVDRTDRDVINIKTKLRVIK